jgi:dihydrofolate reductase
MSAWQNTALLKGDLEEAINRLKQQSGKTIAVQASVSLVQSLLKLGLIDELLLSVHPVVVGEGRRLFEDGDKLTLKLLDVKRSASGVAFLTYGKA